MRAAAGTPRRVLMAVLLLAVAASFQASAADAARVVGRVTGSLPPMRKSPDLYGKFRRNAPGVDVPNPLLIVGRRSAVPYLRRRAVRRFVFVIHGHQNYASWRPPVKIQGLMALSLRYRKPLPWKKTWPKKRRHSSQ